VKKVFVVIFQQSVWMLSSRASGCYPTEHLDAMSEDLQQNNDVRGKPSIFVHPIRQNRDGSE